MAFRLLVIALAQGAWASSTENERCVTVVSSAYNYISFTGFPSKGIWSGCQNRLKVASIYAASDIYCNEQERSTGFSLLAKQCEGADNEGLLSREAVAEYLTDDAIRKMRRVGYQELSPGEPSDAPVIISASYFENMYKTIEYWELETWSHHAFGFFGYAYWGVLLLLGMMYRLSDWIFRRRQFLTESETESNMYTPLRVLERIPLIGPCLHWIQTHLAVPSPLTTTHGRSMLGCTFSTRAEALIVVGFYLLSIILSVVDYRTFPGNIYWPDTLSQILRYSADRTGIMSFANIPLIWLFAGRNNIFSWATGWSFASFSIFHRHVARIATIQAVAHSILYFVMFLQTGKAWRGMSKTYVLWGILSTFVMILLLVTSLDRIRIATYELFLLSHVVLSIIALIGCFYHTVIFDGNQYWKYLWPSVTIWVIDRLLRILRLCYCNLYVNVSNKGLLSISTSRMTYDEAADVVRLEINPGQPSLQPSPGQYYFLYQPFRLTWWESHPFTVAAWSYAGDSVSSAYTRKQIQALDVSYLPLLGGGASGRHYQRDSENGSSGPDGMPKLKLVFWLRPYDGWTRQLRERCLRSAANTAEPTILLEGPYGHTFPLWQYDSVLLIAGGTGIASVAPYIQDHLRRSVEDRNGSLANEKTRVRNMALVWTTKQREFIQDVCLHELKPALEREDFCASFYATRGPPACFEDLSGIRLNIQSRRPHLQSLIINRADDVCSAGFSLAILVCGPPGLADEARAAAHLAMRQGHRTIKFVEESFTW
ncbi:hypothetical protein N7535_000010 [Penicillium sp. DV-2018c]|nr:hypothetical protein N7461_006741 [Penicillium sp. DV-2018c]KAJ5581390.1 hypothetical protein N7535_000010 [Penicillium sp. DV-2018c]